MPGIPKEEKMRQTKKTIKTFGPHLMLDCYGADPAKLADVGLVFQFLDQLPKLIGMQKIGPPQMAKFDDPKIAGVTGVVLIVTSHISIHTYALKGCFFMDVFSCKPFDSKTVEKYARDTFGVTRMESKLVSRGKRFPLHNLSQSPPKRRQS
jgi:S-adenosylmethionine decarboxylase